MIKAPSVTSLRITKLSANQVHIRWDDVGANFYYFVEITETEDQNGEAIPHDQFQWRNLGYTPNEDWFEENTILPETKYIMRVSVAAEGFDRSDWVETEEFKTFETNAYSFEYMKEFALSKKFIDEKFVHNNQDYINFNRDQLVASLMSESFQFTPEFSDISSVRDKVLSENEFHEIQGPIEAVCVDKERTMLAEMDGVLYLFERFQPIVKVSNDKAQNWKYVKLLNDRIGNPVARTCVYQSKTTTYLLGYDRVFYGRRSNDIRWSADDEKFSSQDVTFAKIGDQLHLGFDVEIFGGYARWPLDISKYVEAMTCNDKHLYGVARDTVRYVKLKNAPIDLVEGSPTFGEKLFEEEVLHITGNDKAVCMKMDSIGGKIFALVTGEVKSYGLDPTKPENVIDSESKGVYVLKGSEFVRVFGNTEEERRRIEHGYANMSTDGKEIYFSSSNFKYTRIVEDDEIAGKYPGKATQGVKVEHFQEYSHDKHYHMMSYRAGVDSGYESFKPGWMKYYAEPWFNWMRREGNRCWITNDDHAMVVYAHSVYSKAIDPIGPGGPDRVVHEYWNKGEGLFKAPNIEFNGFRQYAGGILLHKNTGEIVGYYEFAYRVRDEARIIWKPTLTVLKASLMHQERPIEWKPEESKRERDPDLRPLLNMMVPDSYLLQDSNFEKFCEYYLQYLSDGYGTQYNNLLNLIRNKYPREEHAWEYLWSEMNKRNIYLDKDRRDAVVRFFEARRSDFYGTKGLETSYKFLFKLLYNEDVEIDVESKQGLEYDIVVESDNASDDLVGSTIYTATGRSNVTYIERDYEQGKLRWRITIHNLLGRFIAGQEIKSERSGFSGMIKIGVRGKEMLSNNIEYINRSRSYYVMKIRSILPTSRYAADMLRFVHPVGFGFIGITLLTMFINAGLSMKHSETIINKLKTYRWDAGLPSKWTDRIAILDSAGNQEFDEITGEALYAPHPNAGEDFELRDGYNEENGNTIFMGQNPDERRKNLSPLLDQSGVTFSKFRNLVDQRLKDDIGNPRDPEHPTQVKIDE